MRGLTGIDQLDELLERIDATGEVRLAAICEQLKQDVSAAFYSPFDDRNEQWFRQQKQLQQRIAEKLLDVAGDISTLKGRRSK